MKRLLVGILFGGACLYWFAHTIDWSEMITVFRKISQLGCSCHHFAPDGVCYPCPSMEKLFYDL